jgi:soluble lytic murein transglycosylase-like protein
MVKKPFGLFVASVLAASVLAGGHFTVQAQNPSFAHVAVDDNAIHLKKAHKTSATKKKARKSKAYKKKSYKKRSKKRGKKRYARKASPAIVASVKSHARAAGVPVSIAVALVRQESGFNPRATGRAGEIGLMQIKCQTARGMGYRGSCRGLYNTSTNLRYGMRYLRLALKRGGVGYYNAGIHAKRLPKAARRYAASVRRNMGRNALAIAR